MEIAIKNASGKLLMAEGHVRQAVLDLRLTIIPFAEPHAYRFFSLPPHHRDPFDRMIIATALEENLPVIGSDAIFKKYRGLKIIH